MVSSSSHSIVTDKQEPWKRLRRFDTASSLQSIVIDKVIDGPESEEDGNDDIQVTGMAPLISINAY